MERIILSLAHMGGTEQKYVAEAFETNWIVPLGPLVNEFEHRLEKFLGTDHVVALSAGTAAVHLALVMLGVGKGDEVICQSFTFSASANPIRYCGAEPVFVDSESQTWNMDPEVLETAIKERKRITGKYPKAIIPVYLYGMPAKIDEIMAVAAKYGIPVVEDSAEALGSDYKGKKCGTFGEYGVLSFNGNKLITTSGGGALVCPSAEAAERVKFFATQARENRPYYYHEHIGYNYRLSNVSAGIGCGQMEVIEDHLARRREIHGLYVRAPKSSPPPPTSCVLPSTPTTSKAACCGVPCISSPYTATAPTTAAPWPKTSLPAASACPAAPASPTPTSPASSRQSSAR